MGDLVVTTFLTMDGVMQAPGGPPEDVSGSFEHGGWLVPFADEDMGAQVDEWFSHAGAFLLGRGTYEIFAAHWPKVPVEGDRVAWSLNTLPKHVASTTLGAVDWEASQLITGDVPTAVQALKETVDGELQVHGSAGLVQTLLRHELVDELRLIVFPVVVGTGKRLFGEGAVPTTFSLVSSASTSTGALTAAYRHVGGVQTGSFLLEE
ncbi:dihydrofolate reductase family protein [Rhodococcus sp. X156]|uniref:dihydrofolate reductase family protein n=1 Tax=Rhodococcus sp. X156 TaxID=2499145 RepID=UPI000FDBCB33|nr:dihydrofolate reductase family protein [Rhodococcus sp. X156]